MPLYLRLDHVNSGEARLGQVRSFYVRLNRVSSGYASLGQGTQV
jgi:hypothetical protein